MSMQDGFGQKWYKSICFSSLLKGEAPKFSADFYLTSIYVRGPLSIRASSFQNLG
jgi:hypothetical protein